ncbi:MAG: cation:proton antiporter [Phycisphaerales bacterium]
MTALFSLASGGIPTSATSGGGTERSIVLDILVVLAAAALATLGLRRLKLGSIPAYLLVGAVIGPFALGLVRDGANIDGIKSLAIILLMFTIGLHLDLSSVGGGLLSILGVGVVSTIGVVLACWPIGVLMGLSAPAALAVAMAMSMSSTAVVLRLIQQRRETHRLHGRLCVGIAITQDLLSLAMLAAMPLLATWAGVEPKPGANAMGLASLIKEPATTLGGPLFGTIAVGASAVAGVVLLIFLGHQLLPRLLHEAAKDHSGEATLVLSAAVALGAAVLAAFLGFSPELGAFMAGFLLASTPFRYHLAGQLSPMRDLFMAVFFTAVGLKLNFNDALHSWWIVLLGVPLLIAIKAGLIGLSVWGAGATAGVAGRTGLLLAQSGEFTIVILGVASLQGVIAGPAETVPIAITVATLLATPALANWGIRLQRPLAKIPPARFLTRSALREAEAAMGALTDPAELAEAGAGAGPPKVREVSAAVPVQRRVIVAGFGVIGRAVADRLEISGVPFTIVELNSTTVDTQRRLNRNVIYGDIGSPEVLESAGIHDAEAVFLTVPDDDAIMRACQQIRRLAPHVFIVARTSYLSTAFAVQGAGADEVTIGEVAIAEDMARRVVSRLTNTPAADPRPARE